MASITLMLSEMDEREQEIAGTDNAPPGRQIRTRVLKGAYAAFNQEFSAIPCTVRDMSETGAKLQFGDGWFVPERFTLFVDVDGFKVECERVWHKGSVCGVRFVSEKMKTRTHRPQVLKPYDLTDDEQARPMAPEGGEGISVFRRPHAASHFGKRTR